MAGLFIPSTLDMTGFRNGVRQLKQEGKAAGQQTAKEFLKSQQSEFNRQRAALKEAQQRGFMTPQEARKRGQDVSREFNRGVLARLDEMRRAGQQNTAEFDRLQRSLKNVASAGARSARQTTSAFDRLGRSTKLWLASFAGAAGVRIIQRFFSGTLDSLKQFDSALRQSLAIMGDVPAHLERQMADTARRLSRELVLPAEELGRAYFFLASAGLDAEQSIAALPQVASFAKAGMFDLARATDLLTDAQSALGLASKDAQENLRGMARVSDVLVKANTVANATVEQFSEALTTRAGAALRQLNKDVEEGVAVLAAYADQGVKGAEAGTRLDIVLRDLQTRALENAGAFKDLEISVFDSAGNMRNIADIIGDLERALDGMSDAQRRATITQLGFADRSVAALLSVIGLSDRIRDYETALRSAGGITEQVAQKQLAALEQRHERVNQKWQDAKRFMGAVIALPVAEFFLGIADSITSTETPLDRAIEGMRKLNSEAAALLEARRNIEAIREEVERLEKAARRAQLPETPAALRPQDAGRRTDLAQLGGSELVQRRRQILEQINEATRRGITHELAFRQRQLASIDTEIKRREDLFAANKALTDAQNEATRAAERFAQSLELQKVEEQIRAAEIEIQAGKDLGFAYDGATARLEKLIEKREELKALLSPSASGGTAEDEDPVTGGIASGADKATAALSALNKAIDDLRAKQREQATAQEFGLLGIDAATPSLRGDLERLAALRGEIESIREALRTVGDAAPAGATEALAAMEAEATKLAETLGERIPQAREAVVELAGAARIGVPSLRALTGETEALGAAVRTAELAARAAVLAESELQRARIAGDPARIEQAERRLAEAKERVERAAARAAQAIQRSGASAKTAAELTDQLVAALRTAGVEFEKAEDSSAGLGENLRSLESAGRGLIAVADSMGAIDDATRRAATGVLDLLNGIQQIQEASKLGGFAGTLGVLAGGGAVLGGLVGIGSALLGGDGKREEELRRAAEALRAAADRLDDMAADRGPLESAVRSAIETAFGAASEATGVRLRGAGANLPAARRTLVRLEEEARARFEFSTSGELAILVAELDEFIERLRTQAEEELAIRELVAAGATGAADALREEAERQAQLNDLRAAFGDDDPLIARYEALFEAEEEARARRFTQDEEIALARARGFSETAAALERQREREEELAKARTDAERATIAARHAEEDLARQRDIARELEDLQLQAFGTDRERQEFAAQTQMNDAIQRYTDLLNAGVIDQDQFAAAMEAIAAIFQRSIDEIQAAADQLRLSFLDDLAILQAETAGDADAIARIRFQAAQRDRRAEAQRLLDQGVITQADFDALIAALEAAADKFEQGGDSVAAAASAGRLERGPDTVVRDLRGATEVTMVTAVDLWRSSLQVHRQQLTRLVSIEDLLRRGGGAAAYIPSPPGASTASSTTNVNQARTVNLSGLTVNVQAGNVSAANARQVGREIGDGILEQIDRGLGQRQSFARGNAGRMER